MVQTLLAGRKTQTRRIIKFPKDYDGKEVYPNGSFGCKYSVEDGTLRRLNCPYGLPGDLLWVRETCKGLAGPKYYYKADGFILKNHWRWTPSIHMPKEAARIWLRVKTIRVERIQEITEVDAIAEGAKDHLNEMNLMKELGDWKIPSPFLMHQFGFLSLWCQINGCESWLDDPWVWVVEFERVDKPG